MVIHFVPFIAVLLASGTTAGDGSANADEVTVQSSPRAAQARLAEALADADSIEGVTVDRAHHVVRFTIARAGAAYEVIATTTKRGVVTSTVTKPIGNGHFELGNLSWLVDAMQNTTAVIKLTVDDDGAVTLVTDDGTKYMAIPGRGSGGNDVVEARWAAEWDHS